MSDTINNMDAVQYNTIINELRALEAGQQKLEAGIERLEVGQQKLEAGIERLEGGQQKLEAGIERLEVGQQKLETGIERLEIGQQPLRNGLRKEFRGITRRVKCLLVVALLVNGPVIGAIVALVMLKLNSAPM